MSIIDRLFRLGGVILLERPAKKKSIADYITILEESGREISGRIGSASDNEQYRQKMSHVIGIEHWGQSRLKTFLGEALVRDEYNSYRPAREATWPELQDLFLETRQQTISLAKQLEQEAIGADKTALHNAFGDLSVGAWLHYLNMHANAESSRIR